MKKNIPDKTKESIQQSSAVKSSANTVPQSPSSSKQLGRRPSTIRRQQLEEIPKPNWKSLSTGLELLFSEESVKKMWGFDKPKIIIIDMLHDLMKRLEIQKNFESMELNIIAEFHLYNLIFAKQMLFLDDFKAAVLLNIMWTLLITDNPDYKMLYINYTRATEQSLEEIVKRQNNVLNSTNNNNNNNNNKQNQQIQQQQSQQQQQIQQTQIQTPQQSNTGMTPMNGKNIVSFSFPEGLKKTISRDLDSFKKWILKHSFNDPPQQIKIFEAKQIQSIVEFAQNSYFANHALYNYCLNNKNKNEEIKIQLYVDRPLVIPPLSDALYMGQPKIEIPEDEEDLEVARLNGQLGSAQSRDIEDSQNIHENKEIERLSGLDVSGQIQGDDSQGKTKIEGSNQNINAGINKLKDQEELEIRQIVEVKIKAVEEEFTQTIHKRSEEVNKQFEDIVNPKKKK